VASLAFYEYFIMPSQRKFGLIDCPSLKHFQHEAKNASMATVILLVIAVDSIPPDFIQQILIHLTYSPQIIIAINKMETQHYSDLFISTL